MGGIICHLILREVLICTLITMEKIKEPVKPVVHEVIDEFHIFNINVEDAVQIVATDLVNDAQ